MGWSRWGRYESRVTVVPMQEAWTPDVHGGQPGVTALGVWLLKLVDIDTPGSKFFAQMRCVYKMHVPELAKLPKYKVAGERTYYDPAVVGELVAGRQLEFLNAIEVEHMPTQFYGSSEDQFGLLYHVQGDPINVLEMEVKYQGTFKHIFRLEKFPYDLQVLPIQIRIWCGNDHDFQRTWVPLGTKFDLSREHLTFPDWTLDFNMKTEIVSSSGGRCDALLGLRVQRKPWFHFIAATLPLLIITAIALTSFSIDFMERSDRIGHAVTLLLAAVAVKFIVAADVPRVPYATQIDYETLLTYAFLLFVTIAHAMVTSDAMNRAFFYASVAFSILIFTLTMYGPITFGMATRNITQ